LNSRILLTRERCIALDITDPTPWESCHESRRCPLCRQYIGDDDEVMYADGFGKEVILHGSCSEKRDFSAADLTELLGLTVSYCSMRELEDQKQ